MPPSGVGQGSPLRPPLGPHAQYRPDGKPRPPMPGGPPPGMKVSISSVFDTAVGVYPSLNGDVK